MHTLKTFLALIMLIAFAPLNSQVYYEDLEFEEASVSSPYKPANSNHAFIRSKRGNSGVNRNSTADSIRELPITSIVLVFTEMSADAEYEREEANQERWDNLLMTYPEYFKPGVIYKNVCQCNSAGDEAAFKQVQGFYVYYKGQASKTAPVVAEKKTEVKKPEPAREMEPEKPKKEVAEKPLPKVKEEPVVEEKREPVKQVPPPVVNDDDDENAPVAEPVKEPPRRKPAATKPRKSKDTRACRPPCYGFGDEDLVAFFKDNITLTKKQKRKGKKLIAVVKIQLDHEGNIKKTFVTGANDDFNKQVQETLKSMNPWRAAVKAGTAVKSEVKFNLKFSKDCKCMVATDINVIPRQPAKCVCVSDNEIFGRD